MYEESLLWKNLVIAIVAVRTDSDYIHSNACVLLTLSAFLSSALSPVHPAALPASLAGDPLWREDDEKRSVLQVRLQSWRHK